MLASYTVVFCQFSKGYVSLIKQIFLSETSWKLVTWVQSFFKTQSDSENYQKILLRYA